MKTIPFDARSVFIVIIACALACGPREQSSSSSSGTGNRASSKPLTIKGSDTMVILGQRLAEEYMKKNPGMVVQVNGGGSGTGIAALINGSVDLAQSSRPMKEDEKKKVETARGSKVAEVPVALDALAVFVNAASPVKTMTIEQVANIYMGKTKNWQEVGGPNATIVLYGRESSSGTYDYFREHVLSKKDFAPNVQTLQGTAAIINAVAKDKNGIGYGGIAYAHDVRLIGVKGATAAVEPNEQTVRDGSYPLARKLFFYYPESAPEGVTKFVQWTLTPEAQALVTSVGYFPLHVGAAPASTETTPTAAATTTTSGK